MDTLLCNNPGCHQHDSDLEIWYLELTRCLQISANQAVPRVKSKSGRQMNLISWSRCVEKLRVYGVTSDVHVQETLMPTV